MNLIEKPLDALRPHPRNYNPHSERQVGELEQSLDDFEQYKPIVAWRDPDDGLLYIIAGHGLWLAAQKRGDETILVNDRSDLSREQALALMAADNFTANEPALFDFDALGDLLDDFDDPLEIPGIDEGVLEELGLGDGFLAVGKDALPNPRQLPLDVIYTLQSADATCCLAVRAGLKYGIQSASYTLCPYCLRGDENHRVEFIDNNYFDYDHVVHLKAVRDLSPKYATVMDIMTKEQCARANVAWHSFEQVMGWAQEIEQYAENAIVIPKYDCLDKIPERFVLGYSVPTSHGGTPLPVEMFRGRRVHLLGGSWKAQLAHMAQLGDDVVSLDNNYIGLQARKFGMAITPNGENEKLQNIGLGHINNPCYVALAISFGAIGAKINELYAGNNTTESE